MIVKVIYLTDGTKQWASLLIDNISILQQAVQDIIGDKIAKIHLNDHSIYDKDRLFNNIINLDTAKVVFKDICQNMYNNEPVIMNMNGGYISKNIIDWEVNDIKSFEFKSWKNTNFLTLLKRENGLLEDLLEVK